MFLQTKPFRQSTSAPRAITLVEMLISMAITLVMMAAVVNLFANIGAGVRNRRASMELGSQLRAARARLFKDLAGVTCPARPKLPSDDHDDGYFELIEGQYSDKNPSELVSAALIDIPDPNDVTVKWGLQHQTSLIPRDNSGRLVQWDDANNNGIVDSAAERTSVQNRSSASALGDYDDILAMTVRSESEPFVGRMPVWNNTTNRWAWQTIESDLAEIIWYAVENPADGSLGEPGMRTIYRRVLLIAPWVTELPGYLGSTLPSAPIELDRVYYQLSDISFHRVGDIRVPNTLSDLTKRENRFSHDRDRFPHIMETRAIRNDPLTPRNNFPEFFANSKRPVFHPFGLPFEWDETESGNFNEQNGIPITPPGEDHNNAGVATIGDDRKGEDVMLNDVLAFDLRVYDPGAPLITINNGPVLEPTDSGWNPSATGVTVNTVGFGAFVDLGWDPNYYGPTVATYPRYTPNPALDLPVPQFQDPHTPGWHRRNPFKPDDNTQRNFTFGYPATYDTWPYHYESDGIDQEEDDFDPSEPDYFPNLAADNGTGVDQGTNGLDDNVDGTGFYNGVDDPLERETQPPYNYPLRAVQAKIRVYDREARQIREATVTRNFVPQ